MEVKLDFKEAMRLDMEQKELSEAKVGAAMGITQQAVGKWLDRGFPPMSRVAELRALLGENSNFAKLTHEDLFGGGRVSRTPSPIRDAGTRGRIGDAGQEAPPRTVVPQVQQFASHEDRLFKECLPKALQHNLEVRMRSATFGATTRLDYASKNVVVEMLHAKGFMWSQSWSAAMLRLMLFRDVECPGARAVFIVISEEKEKRFPQLVQLAAKQYNIELLHVESGAQAAAFIAGIEGEDMPEVDDADE